MQGLAGIDIQQVVNEAVATAFSAVDRRVATIVGDAVSTIEAAANRVEVATVEKMLTENVTSTPSQSASHGV